MSKPTVSRLALLIFLSALTLIQLARASMNNYGEYLAEHTYHLLSLAHESLNMTSYNSKKDTTKRLLQDSIDTVFL